MKADFEKGTKICSKCRKELPLDSFHKNKSQSDGLNCYCNECNFIYNNNYFKNNSQKILNRSINWRNLNLERCRKIEENQRICFNYRNLQPLWASENNTKKAKVPDNVEELVEFLKKEIYG